MRATGTTDGADLEVTMITIDPEIRLGDLVTVHPELARELERRGLDYCCGGDVTLETACRERGLDPVEVTADLTTAAEPPSTPDWAALDAVGLLDHILTTHHRRAWDELARLAASIDTIVAVHGERHPELHDVAACFAEIRADLEPHLRREEQVLFPMIRELATASTRPSFHCGSIRNPISVMLGEHDHVGALLARMRTLTAAYTTPPDGCASYQACYRGLAEFEADTHTHVHKENNRLFPMVVAMEERLAAHGG
jgi:regulator of cell morphogenesis and NO signaling